MKKTAKQISIKPIALVVAIAAGATLSFAASALPVASSNSLSAVNGIVNEDICAGNTSTVISGGVRTTTASSTQCQNRNLDPTVGFQGAITTPAGGVVADTAAMRKHGAAGDTGQELYVADVNSHREATVTFSPSRAMSVTRFTTANTVTGLASNLGVNVNSAVGGNAGWLTGAYTFVQHKHGFHDMTNGLQVANDPSGYAMGNNYIGSIYDSELLEPAVAKITFNGDGTCTFNSWYEERSFYLTKDPDGVGLQPDGSNYQLRAPVDLTSIGAPQNTPGTCSYTWSGADVVSVTLQVVSYDLNPAKNRLWTTDYNVSKDLRYLAGTYGNDNPALLSNYLNESYSQGLDVGIRDGAVTNTLPRTYLYNAPASTLNITTSADGGFENPLTTHLLEQQIECMARGAITLSAGGVCSVASEVSTCASRGAGGYGETTIAGGDGTLVDNLSASQGITTPTACAYTVSGSGAMQLTLTVATPDGPQPLVLNGQMSNNGEVFAVTGRNAGQCVGDAPCLIPAPDTDNIPPIPEQNFVLYTALLATAYDGSLALDTDNNGLNNLKEFQWAKLVMPPSSVPGDTDGDGFADIVTWNQTTGNGFQYLMASNNLRPAAPNTGTAFVGLLPASNAKIAVHDFNRDGADDILMRNTSTGAFTLEVSSIGSPGMIATPIALSSVLTTTVQGVADFNRDGYPDVLMRNSGTNAWSVYFLQGDTVLGSSAVAASLSAADQFAAAADFNGDGYADVLTRNTGTFAWFLYELEGATVIKSGSVGLIANSAWTLQGVNDFNADGVADVVVRNVSTGGWFMYAFNEFSQVPTARFDSSGAMPVTADSAWVTLGTKDYDGNGTADILFFRASDRSYFLYGLGGVTGRTILGGTVIPMTTGIDWSFQQAADFNGDGKYDFLLRNGSTGVWAAYGFNSYTAGLVIGYSGYANSITTDLANIIVK